ncbi:Asp-tRNA(Asn)/Glu-tRNA(Gln) amidotransferase subunit GatC [Rickettsia endosymbiont of Cardiosporidium cionae]|uniref:Asp-tRNA(Asn)/Glu-tRNA(Gln) amidotransferase subunit GatC n=1 Tax=Rickettsia endosymbiont of Cardiosporidium cionae TaxID=2777155 RepID=UPI001893B583|nr:Asp-tRNA(Asn)/Glu-tRNA(Gln) amidotransferase subunit GatC [Rickettsia endosymbiont of Cardiosporidium cionae]KAF8818322.1 Asp-tRNA(Asn)/Glu-tRNA(Gln) amidotransferase subunit GatC [Rickettsia endosymbiont of Cardiosporidium cionae]
MINNSEMEKLEKLAMIKLSSNERKVFIQNFSNTLKMLDQLHKIDCDNVDPLTSVVPSKARSLRKDFVTVSNISNQIFTNIPEENTDITKETNCFIVPKILE